MKPSHYTTPRRLSDAVFTGRDSVQIQPSDRAAGYVLAVLAGVGLAFALVAWLVS